MPILLSKLALIEDLATDNVVTTSIVLDGGDGATRTGFEIETVAVTIEDGQIYWPKANYSLEIAGLRNSSNKSQLDTWADNGTDLLLAGVSDGYIFQGYGKLNNDAGLDGEVATWRMRIGKQAVRGYKDGRMNARMMLSENGFNEYLWGDSDSSGVADGWSKTGTGTATFGSGAQTLEADENTVGIEREIYFPFEGEDITFAISADAYTNASNLTRRLEMEYLDSSGNTLSTDSSTFTGTGRKSVTNTVPADTVSIKFRIEITETGTGSADMTFSNPSFRVDGSTQYIAR